MYYWYLLNFLLHLSFNAATTLMITKLQVNVTPRSILLNWSHPRYLPEFYQAFVKCKSSYFSGAFSHQALPADHSLKMQVPHPGSQCKVIFLAVYNRASLDPGMKFSVTLETLSRYIVSTPLHLPTYTFLHYIPNN